jgi:hypothetical protein
MTIIVVYAYRDGNERTFFVAFDEDAAECACIQARDDRRFAAPHDVGFDWYDPDQETDR